NQLALLAGLEHDRATAPRVGELLAAVEGSALVADPDSPPAVNVRETRRAYDPAVRVPRTLVAELARVTALAQHALVEAYHRSDRNHFRPWVERVVALKREEGAALRPGVAVYDTLLDEHEPGMTGQQVEALFGALRGPLVELVATLAGARRR